jgi:hypothetical protein
MTQIPCKILNEIETPIRIEIIEGASCFFVMSVKSSSSAGILFDKKI